MLIFISMDAFNILYPFLYLATLQTTEEKS